MTHIQIRQRKMKATFFFIKQELFISSSTSRERNPMRLTNSSVTCVCMHRIKWRGSMLLQTVYGDPVVLSSHLKMPLSLVSFLKPPPVLHEWFCKLFTCSSIAGDEAEGVWAAQNNQQEVSVSTLVAAPQTAEHAFTQTKWSGLIFLLKMVSFLLDFSKNQMLCLNCLSNLSVGLLFKTRRPISLSV